MTEKKTGIIENISKQTSGIGKTGKQWHKKSIQLDDGFWYQVFSGEAADLKVLDGLTKGTQVEVEFETNSSGEFTNHDIVAVNVLREANSAPTKAEAAKLPSSEELDEMMWKSIEITYGALLKAMQNDKKIAFPTELYENAPSMANTLFMAKAAARGIKRY